MLPTSFRNSNGSSQSNMRLLLYTMTGKRLAIFLVCLLCFSSGFLVIGYCGPGRLIRKSSSIELIKSSDGLVLHSPHLFTVNYELNGVSSANRRIWLTVTPYKDSSALRQYFRADIAISGTMKVRSNGNEQWSTISSPEKPAKYQMECVRSRNAQCKSATIATIPFLKYDQYKFELTVDKNNDLPWDQYLKSFEVAYYTINEELTFFEILLRGSFTIISVIVLIVYLARLRNYAYSELTVEQTWVMILLYLLIFFNNPLFFLTVTVSGWVFPVLNSFFQVNFIVVLLMAWLFLFDGIRPRSSVGSLQEQIKKNWLFYLPKILLGIVVWCFIFTLHLVEELGHLDDPLLPSLFERPGFVFAKVGMFVLLTLYVIYLIIILSHVIQLHAGSAPFLKKRATFLLAFTICVIFWSVIGTMTALWFTFDDTFVGTLFYTVFNTYVITMAVAYSPENAERYQELGNNSPGFAEAVQSMPVIPPVEDSRLEYTLEETLDDEELGLTSVTVHVDEFSPIT